MTYILFSLILIVVGYIFYLRRLNIDTGNILIPWLIILFLGFADNLSIVLSPTNDIAEKIGALAFIIGPILIVFYYLRRKSVSFLNAFENEFAMVDTSTRIMLATAFIAMLLIYLLDLTVIGDNWYVEFSMVIVTAIIDGIALLGIVKEILRGHREPILPWFLWMLSMSVFFYYEVMTKGSQVFLTIAPWVTAKTIIFCVIAMLFASYREYRFSNEKLE